MKIETLKLNKEFKRMYYRASFAAHPLIVTYISKKKQKNIRYGITAGKKAGNAVKRNRARRIIRAAFLGLAAELPAGYDFVFVAREKTYGAKSTDIAKVMRKHFAKLMNI